MKFSNSINKNHASFTFEPADALYLSPNDILRLKTEADASETRRFRYCLHSSTQDLVQEMLIAFRMDSEVPIHRHLRKTESFHLVEGRLEVLFFDDMGRLMDKLVLGDISTGLPFMYRLSSALWHTVKPLTEYVILHEITTGPFDKDDTEIFKR